MDQQVRSYRHLAQLPRADDALRMLKTIASAVKPIMRNHNWRVGELAEFYPRQDNLLGLNVNRGQQVCLRLRHAGDKTLFLELDMVIDTMLHELCHNVHGPHNGAFHALWEKLRDEHAALALAGFTGSSFLSEGRRLGGSAAVVSARERGRLVRANFGGRTLGGGGGIVAAAAGRRLGGGTVSRLLTPELRRAAAAEAAERRKRALEGCAAEKLSDTQIRDMGDTARRNGFSTQAEEDRANDVAIAAALAELMGEGSGGQQQEQPDRPAQPVQSTLPIQQGRSSLPAVPTEPPPPYTREARSSSRQGAPASRPLAASRPLWLAAQSRLVDMSTNNSRSDRGSETRNDRSGNAGRSSSGGTSIGWVCTVCTLYNPGAYLCCDACGSERKANEPTHTSGANGQPDIIDLT